MSQELAVIPEGQVGDALPASAIKAQVQLIQEVMKTVMHRDEHYGTIPGTPKPTLLKPGAEKLCLTFRLDPQYESTERFLGEHLFVKSRCTLYHSTTGRRLGSGEGSCSTKESKYAYRKGQRICPKCHQETIIKGKQEYGGGWLCFQKKGGCGAKWPNGAQEIESQNTERIPNEDLADQYNTVLKMANKRSLIAAVLNVTAASDIFTQDLEDMPREVPTPEAAEAPTPAAAPAGAPDLRDDHASAGPQSPSPADQIIAKIKRALTSKEVNEIYAGCEDSLKQDIYQAYSQRLKELKGK